MEPDVTPEATHRHFGQARCACPPSCGCHEPTAVKPSDDVPAELARVLAECGRLRQEVEGWQARHEALAVRLDEAGVQLITAHVDGERLRQEADGLREQLLRTEEQCRRHVNQADAEAARYKAGRDAAREDLAMLRAEMEYWPRCPHGCGCRLGVTGPDGENDADRRDCACDGPCCMECLENGYPDAPAYRDIAGGAGAARGDSKPYGPGISLPWEIRETRVTIWDMP